jgi:ABC-type transporter MlaC component
MYNFTIKLSLMKFNCYIILFCCASFYCNAQEIPANPKQMGYEIKESDDVLNDTIQLEEIVVSKQKLDPEAKKQFLILQSRVYRTYPYAKMASERLTALNKGMARLSTEREKKKYFKIVENYLNNEFEDKLKKLSRSQGRILVKLIHRQTGRTTFDLVKTLKSGWKAFWSNTAASMFDINLKSEFAPYVSNEDFLIETILVRAFESGRLQNQPPANPIDIDKLNDFWENKNRTITP